MAILVSCECGREFLTDDGNAGREAICLDCRRVLTIPTASDQFREPAPRVETIVSPFSRRAIASLGLGVLSFGLLFLTGILAIGFGIGAIGDIRKSRGRLRGLWLAMMGMALGLVNSTALTVVVITFATHAVRAHLNEQTCEHNLKELHEAMWRVQWGRQIGMTRGSFPSAAIFDRKGRPLLSWRVAILPALGPEGEQLFRKFHLNEPWDSPHNRALIPEMPAIYRCPSMTDVRPGTTSYQLVVGPGTAFVGSKPVEWDDFNKGKIASILVVESDSPVPWTAPIEITYDPKDPFSMRGANHKGDYHVLNTNGSVAVHEWVPADPKTDEPDRNSKP